MPAKNTFLIGISPFFQLQEKGKLQALCPINFYAGSIGRTEIDKAQRLFYLSLSCETPSVAQRVFCNSKFIDAKFF